MSFKWIASMAPFASIVFPALELAQSKRICEIGTAAAEHSKLLYNKFLKRHSGELVVIDPAPRGPFSAWIDECDGMVTHFSEYSLTGIPKVSGVDAWFIDGDHNWYTVFNELLLIEKASEESNIPALIFLHDVGWPCGRRDMYYDPRQIPTEFVQPFSLPDVGIVMENLPSVKGLLVGPNWALKEGGPRNGVMTAVEDFMSAAKQKYYFMNIPVLLGLGVLINVDHPAVVQIVKHFAPYHNNPMLAIMEQDRITQYMSVVAMSHMSMEKAGEQVDASQVSVWLKDVIGQESEVPILV